MKIFLAAVRAGSYTAAGRHLGINRTTVGRRIDHLEKQLGVELFHYRTASPYPTDAGMILLQTATRMEAAVLELDQKLADQSRRFPTIRLSASAGIGSEFMSELAEFQRINPKIPIEILSELDPVDAVTHRRADLGLAILRLPPKHLEGIEVAALHQAQYGAKQRTHDRPLGWGTEMNMAIPAQWTGSNPSGPRAEADGLPCFNNWHELKQAVIAGMGTASLWTFAVQDQDQLEQISEADPRFSFPLWLIRRATFPPSPSLLLLIDFLKTRLSARLA